MAIMNPGSKALRSITNALSTALLLHLLLGAPLLAAEPELARDVGAVLNKIGAGAVAADVAALASELCALAAVNEAVHGGSVYQLLGGQLVEAVLAAAPSSPSPAAPAGVLLP